MKSHERLSELEFDPSLTEDKDFEFYIPKTREKKRKKDFNKTYERKMKELLKEGDLAEKAARNMFGANDSSSNEDLEDNETFSSEI